MGTWENRVQGRRFARKHLTTFLSKLGINRVKMESLRGGKRLHIHCFYCFSDVFLSYKENNEEKGQQKVC